MNRINTSRVILGGLVAGIILFGLMGALHHLILMNDWMAWKAAMGGVIHAPSIHRSMALWFAMSVVFGITGVWIYAGIRPRYGAGPKTAFLAGFLLWLSGHVTAALNQLALGILPRHITVVSCAGALVAILLSTLAGAAIYKE
jgi:hypothetical protein